MNIIRVLTALLLGGCCVGLLVWLTDDGQTETKQEEPVKESLPKKAMLPISNEGPHPKAVAVDGTDHQFEPMVVNSTASHTFKIKNEGPGPLYLQQWDTTCKCTLSSLSGEAVPPGEVVDVKLEWTPKSVGPSFGQSAQINTNDPDQRMITFRVTGDVWQPLITEPTGAWDFGEVRGSQPAQAEGIIFSKTLDRFEILGHTTTTPQLSMHFVPLSADQLTTAGAKSGYTMRLTMTPRDKVGRFAESITVRTDVDAIPEFRVQVVGEQMGAVVAYPYVPPGESAKNLRYDRSALALGLGTISGRQQRKGWYGFNIAGKSGAKPKILSVKSGKEYVRASVSERATADDSGLASFILTVEVDADAPAAIHGKGSEVEVLVTTDHPQAKEIRFLVRFAKLAS